MRRPLIFTVFLILLLVGAWWVFVRSPADSATDDLQIIRQTEVMRGPIVLTVDAIGAVEPEALVALSFDMSGTVTTAVAPGQRVQSGDVVAQLNSEELALVVQQARDALRVLQVQLEQVENRSPSESDLAVAAADVDAAKGNLAVAEAQVARASAILLEAEAQKARLFVGPRTSEIAQSEAALSSARTAELQARITHDQTLACVRVRDETGQQETACPLLGPAEEQARAALESARASVRAAEAQLSRLQNWRPFTADIDTADAAIAAAEAGIMVAEGQLLTAVAAVARAEAVYDRILDFDVDEEVAILQAQTDAAQTNLQLAEWRFERSRIVSPIDGIVTEVMIGEGLQALAGTPVMRIIDQQAFHILVEVDEIDIEQVAVDQAVDIRLDALDETVIDGHVADIAAVPSSRGGVTTYAVTVNLDRQAEFVLRAGMSASAAIRVDEVENALIIPNWAIRFERTTGEQLVDILLPDGQIGTRTIQTGARNDEVSEVTTGLDLGDVVILTNARDPLNLFGN